jgi:hypothetical protein
MSVLKEGKLKKLNGFFSSSTKEYRLLSDGQLQIKQSKKKPWSEKYKMEKYYITLSSKDRDKFYLIPLP